MKRRFALMGMVALVAGGLAVWVRPARTEGPPSPPALAPQAALPQPRSSLLAPAERAKPKLSLSKPETEDALREIEANDLSPEILEKLNRDTATATERARVEEALRKRNALWEHWMALRTEEINDKVKDLEAHRTERKQKFLEDEP